MAKKDRAPKDGVRRPRSAATPTEAPPAEARSARTRSGIRRQKRKLLVVDDNLDSAASLRVLLELAGHEVVVVHDGARALETAGGFTPDAVLLDIGLPDMDGYEVARRLRAKPGLRETLIIATTGFGRPEDLRRSREAGIDEHLVKPLDPEALAHLLARGRG